MQRSRPNHADAIGEYVDHVLYAYNQAFFEKAVTLVPREPGCQFILEPERHRLYLVYDPATMLVTEVIDGGA